MYRIYINGRFLTQSTTGVQRYARDLCQALDDFLDRDAQVRRGRFLILTPRRGLRSVPNYKWLELRPVGYLSGHAWEQLELPWYCSRGMLFCPGNTAPLWALLRNHQTVTTVHSLAFQAFPNNYRASFRFLYHTLIPLSLHFSRAIITVSHVERQRILNHYRFKSLPARLRVVPLGVSGFDTNCRDGQQRLFPTGIPCVAYLGALGISKNIQRLVDALAVINGRRPVGLLIAGGHTAGLQPLGIRVPASLANKIQWVGQLEDKSEVASIYQSADCFVFPSLYESFGLPPLEAMKCGCPVVVSDNAQMHNLCGDAALYCDPYDAQDIAAKIEMIIDNPGLAQELRCRGRVRVQQFSWNHSIRETLDIFQEILAA